jgi:hypothetical protein
MTDKDRRFAEARRFIEMAPSDTAWAQAAVRPYRDMTPGERLQELARLNAVMDTLLAGREPEREDGEMPFWRLWRGENLGLPRCPPS